MRNPLWHPKLRESDYNILGLPGGFARNFNIWGAVGWVNVGVHVYTWYAAGVLMCTHGTLLVCSCVHMVRCWCVMCKGVTLGVGWGVLTFGFICKHGTLLVCSCVHMVRCWCVDVHTWYAASVFMCTHGTRLVCHAQRCYAWGGVGWGVLTFGFICKHGTLLVC